ncbi:DUF485 domain-containing protein [Burkholderiaceae bacterium DAT-1]|nr:DUF485 domain-containing protein [Burkholderiaceae bacterium DAT-1]
MEHDLIASIKANPKFAELVHKKTSLGWTLSIIMLFIYYGFILLIAFNPQFLGTPVSEGSTMTIGIPVGVGVILSAFVLTGFYVKRANSEFDDLTRQVVEETRK